MTMITVITIITIMTIITIVTIITIMTIRLCLECSRQRSFLLLARPAVLGELLETARDVYMRGLRCGLLKL